MSLESRLSKIELAMAGQTVVGRIFRLAGGTGAPGEAEQFLAGQGLAPTADDLIICRTVYRPGATTPEVFPMTLDFAINSTTRHEDALAELN